MHADASKIASAFRDTKIWNPVARAFIANPNPIFRDLPDYYDMKFSVNPKEAGVLEENSSNIFDWRLKVNLGFGIGLPGSGISDDLGYDAMEIYDDG